MKFIYWILKFAWLLLILLIGTMYLSNLGVWSVVIGIVLFLVGNMVINKKMERYFN